MDDEEEGLELPGSSGSSVLDRCGGQGAASRRGEGQERGSRARAGLGLWVTATSNAPRRERRGGASSHRAPASGLELKTCIFTCWW